jgi:hypothetical protein
MESSAYALEHDETMLYIQVVKPADAQFALLMLNVGVCEHVVDSAVDHVEDSAEHCEKRWKLYGVDASTNGNVPKYLSLPSLVLDGTGMSDAFTGGRPP